MKTLQNIFIFIVLAFSNAIYSCEEYNALDNLGDTSGANVASVYLAPLAPSIQAGLTKELEVQYWSLDDNFVYTGLWDSVAVSNHHIVTIDDKEFKASLSNTFSDWKEYNAYPFDFANWNPENKAYTRKVSYIIDLTYAKIRRDKSEITIDQFLTDLPDDFSSNMYSFFTNNLSRSRLNKLLVDNNAMTQIEFDMQYGDNGNLSGDGKSTIISAMSNIGDKTIIGDNYEFEIEYEVFLSFRATNGSGIFNDYTRSFLVF